MLYVIFGFGVVDRVDAALDSSRCEAFSAARSVIEPSSRPFWAWPVWCNTKMQQSGTSLRICFTPPKNAIISAVCARVSGPKIGEQRVNND